MGNCQAFTCMIIDASSGLCRLVNADGSCGSEFNLYSLRVICIRTGGTVSCNLPGGTALQGQAALVVVTATSFQNIKTLSGKLDENADSVLGGFESKYGGAVVSSGPIRWW
jgi:hypothetical protein